MYVKASWSPWIICCLVQNYCCSVAKSCLILCDPMDCYLPLNMHSVTERCISTMKAGMLFHSLLPVSFQLHASDLFLGTTFSGIFELSHVFQWWHDCKCENTFWQCFKCRVPGLKMKSILDFIWNHWTFIVVIYFYVSASSPVFRIDYIVGGSSRLLSSFYCYLVQTILLTINCCEHICQRLCRPRN